MKTILLGLFLLATCSSQAQVIFTEQYWEDVLTQATEENKIIFINLSAPWAGPSQWMNKEVYLRSDVGQYFNEHFINVEVDSESPFGKNLRRRYKIKKIPTALFINQQQKELFQKAGKIRYDRLIEMGQAVIRLEEELLKNKSIKEK